MVAFFDNERLIKAWNEHERLNAEQRSPKLFMNEYMQEWIPLPGNPRHEKWICRDSVTVSVTVSPIKMMTRSDWRVEARREAQVKLFDTLGRQGCESCVDCPHLKVLEDERHFAARDETEIEFAARCNFSVCAIELSAAAIQGDAVFPQQKKADPDVPLNYDGSW